MRAFLAFILGTLARFVLRRHKPIVVGVTGSVGKTSTKEAISTVLEAQYRNAVRFSQLNRNTEIGVPCAILGIRPAGRNVVLWAARLAKGFVTSLLTVRYPEVLVLEMAADRPHNIAQLVAIAPPQIAVVTAVGEIPVHVEFFAGPQNLAREKARLVEALPPSGWAVLNFDDMTVLDMRERTDAHVLTFGFGDEADVRATAYEVRTTYEHGREIPEGISFKIEHEGTIVPVRLSGVFAKTAVYAALAAACVGLSLKMHLVEISEALIHFMPPPGRLRLLSGIKRSWVLDDTYNAAPQSMHAALDTLNELPGARKIAVLADMLELGKFTEAAHRAAGEQAAGICDMLITVGDRMRFAAHEAVARGMDEHAVFSFSAAQEAREKLQELLREQDLVLVKGSRAMHMEGIVREVMAEPEKANTLLVGDK